MQDRIGEHEDMELDDLDEQPLISNDELTTSTTFTEEQTVQATTITTTMTIPPPFIPSLYDEGDDENSGIPIESNPVSCLITYRYYFLTEFK